MMETLELEVKLYRLTYLLDEATERINEPSVEAAINQLIGEMVVDA